jgi:hypothetical protein
MLYLPEFGTYSLDHVRRRHTYNICCNDLTLIASNVASGSSVNSVGYEQAFWDTISWDDKFRKTQPSLRRLRQTLVCGISIIRTSPSVVVSDPVFNEPRKAPTLASLEQSTDFSGHFVD